MCSNSFADMSYLQFDHAIHEGNTHAASDLKRVQVFESRDNGYIAEMSNYQNKLSTV